MSDARSRTPVVQPDGQTAVPVPPSMPTPQAQTRAAERRSRRLATDAQVWALHRQGWSNRAMAQPLGIGRMTVVRSLQAPTFPERTGHTNPGTSVLTPDQERLLKRWNAGGREALQRFRDLRRHGYTGSYHCAMTSDHKASTTVPRKVSTVVLTSAGFSVNAGLPLTSDLVRRGREESKIKFGDRFVDALDEAAHKILKEPVGVID